jgi:hypothetical protein
MFTKDYMLLVGLKYYIKLSTKLLSKETLSTYIKPSRPRIPLDPLAPRLLEP